MKAKKANGAKKAPDFVVRAERAFARVARKVRSESRRSGLRAIVFSKRENRVQTHNVWKGDSDYGGGGALYLRDPQATVMRRFAIWIDSFDGGRDDLSRSQGGVRAL